MTTLYNIISIFIPWSRLKGVLVKKWYTIPIKRFRLNYLMTVVNHGYHGNGWQQRQTTKTILFHCYNRPVIATARQSQWFYHLIYFPFILTFIILIFGEFDNVEDWDALVTLLEHFDVTMFKLDLDNISEEDEDWLYGGEFWSFPPAAFCIVKYGRGSESHQLQLTAVATSTTWRQKVPQWCRTANKATETSTFILELGRSKDTCSILGIHKINSLAVKAKLQSTKCDWLDLLLFHKCFYWLIWDMYIRQIFNL